MRIGFIGAGMMGQGMVSNLLAAGHGAWVLAHRNRAPIDDLIGKGAREAVSLEALAKEAELIILCLSTAKVVEEVVGRLRPYLGGAHIVMDTGTTDPETTRRLARELSLIGAAYADAPMTGGPEQAMKGELGVLVGADEDTFAKIRPVIECYATRIKHFGPPGSGHLAKLISNYLVIGMVALVTEAFATARAAHVDWGNLYEVMLNGSGNSGVLRKMLDGALAGDFDGYRFSIANAAKDIGYYAELAERLDRLTPLAQAVVDMFAKAAVGHGGRNVSHLLDPAIDDVT